MLGLDMKFVVLFFHNLEFDAGVAGTFSGQAREIVAKTDIDPTGDRPQAGYFPVM